MTVLFVGTSDTAPPAADTTDIGAPGHRRYRILLSRLQLPPRDTLAGAIACGGPPATAIVRSEPLAKKPSDRLSGDQNGCVASSVSGSERATLESRGRT